MGIFELDVCEFEWIDGAKDDPEDKCLHGRVIAQIGSQSIDYCCTVSAAALYFLRTLTENHFAGEGDAGQMLPCCGHFMVADQTLENVWIGSCMYGIDFDIVHDGETIEITFFENANDVGNREELIISEKARVPLSEYWEKVLKFADKVEAYYNSCKPKVLKDDFERDAYTAFWNEWHRRRGKFV